MVSSTVTRTVLWQKTLAARTDDPDAVHRDRLRTALISMRDAVIPFVRRIQQEVVGLTVHDESHLDALWETGDIIAGPDFELTPVEAFTFGAAALLHDTALTVAAYPGGIDELTASVEWKDGVAARLPEASEISYTSLRSEHEDVYQSVLFSVLRLLHASQAEKLATYALERPDRKEQLYLISDSGIRDALGASVGRIAHSHHWSLSQVAERLNAVAGGIPGLPVHWRLNEIKVACLLRCADAAHIDSRRAPTLLFSIARPGGVSRQHWAFQNRLNQLTIDNGKLHFVSGQPFTVDEAASWWLAHDTLRMIDGEIKNSNAVLADIGTHSLAARSVAGIESPRLLSKLIKVSGWVPVDAEVRVSDPVHLARTLGGRNLYGEGVLAPIRELLQNAVDSVRARRLQEQRQSGWGEVRILLDGSPGQPENIWIHVDDTGVGMSERVLTGPLIDFGKSMWTSSIVEEEFPGLRSKGPRPIGKFGIGFFSSFLLGSTVLVTSRKYNLGDDSTRTLVFNDLGQRPIIRAANPGELPQDFSTRVSVRLNKESVQYIFNEGKMPHIILFNFLNSLRVMTCAVDVNIEIIDKINDRSSKHKSNWIDVPADDFLDDVLAQLPSENKDFLKKVHAPMVDNIVEPDGTVVGRAACYLAGDTSLRTHFISVGGFCTPFDPRDDGRVLWRGRSLYYLTGLPIVGVVTGDTDDVSRKIAVRTASRSAMSQWASRQAGKIDQSKFSHIQLVKVAHSIEVLGGDPGPLPFGFLGGRFATMSAILKEMQSTGSVIIPLNITDYQYRLKMIALNEITTPYFTIPLKTNVLLISNDDSRLEYLADEEDNERKRRLSAGVVRVDSPAEREGFFARPPLSSLARLATEVWGGPFDVTLEKVQLFSAELVDVQPPKLSLVLARAGGSRA